MSNEAIAIVGAGIAGLTTALALLRKGIPVTVFEQASQLAEVGAGLQLGANGTRVLYALGLERELGAAGVEPNGKEVRLWNTGETRRLFDLGAASIERYGFPYLMIHRADLHTMLADAVKAIDPAAIRLGSKLDTIVDVDGDASNFRLSFHDDESVACKAIIGADGVHSVVRSQLFGAGKPQYSGCMAWRGMAKTDNLPDHLQAPVGTNWVGPGAHVIHYPVRGGALLNFVGIVERQEWTAESWTQTGTRKECLADFAKWHPDVHSIINNLESAPNRWGLMYREPMETWRKGNACLIGDACHPMLPFLAQGANIAIEDGYAMGECVAAYEGQYEKAFSAFEAMRKTRADSVVAGSAENTKRFHNPALADPVFAREYLDEQWQPERVQERYDWLFRHDGTQGPGH